MTHTISKETVEEMKQALKPKEPKKLTPWNIYDYLKTNEDRVNYLEAIALGEIAESLGLLAVVYDHPSKLYANGLRMSPPDLDMTEIQAIVEKHQKTKQN